MPQIFGALRTKNVLGLRKNRSTRLAADIGIVPGNDDVSNPVQTCCRVLMDCRLYKEEHSLKKQTGNHILKLIAEHMEAFTCMM